jgi:hypothetical protein
MGDLVAWLAFNNDLAGRAAARRFAAACDIALGWPRDLNLARLARTETQCRIVRNTSTLQLAVEIDALVRSLSGRVVTVTDGGSFQITISMTGADRTEVARLAGWPSAATDVNPWADRPARDGIVL